VFVWFGLSFRPHGLNNATISPDVPAEGAPA
jgi:hypothetical protein